jgi:hypothetical protein
LSTSIGSTVTTTAATAANIGAVRATLGGNVTVGAPTCKERVYGQRLLLPLYTIGKQCSHNDSTQLPVCHSDNWSYINTYLLQTYATNNVGTSYGIPFCRSDAALAATQSQTVKRRF